MKVRKTLLAAAAGMAGLAAHAGAQAPVPPVPAAVPPPPLPVGAAPQPPTPPGTTIWSKLGISKEQKEACKRQLCRTPLGQLINNSKAPLMALSGGLVQPFCPLTPSAAELADPGAVGAAAKIQADEAGAKMRRAAVRYLGTVDCHYWPEAEAALIASLREDRNECVRLEAALALGSGCCCTKKTIEALTIVVSCSDRDGAPKETSYRVHAAAGAALDHCLACYASVKTAPAETPPPPPPPPVEGAGPPPPEGATPPPPPPPPAIPNTSAAKPISTAEAKPAPGLTATVPPKAPAPRPVGPEYYARIARAPLVAILAEARRVAEKYHSTPILADSPFDTQGHTVAAIMSYASGPDTQAVIPAGMTVPTGEVRAEVVSARPSNLWDVLSKPAGDGEVVVVKAQTAVVQSPAKPSQSKPAVAKQDLAPYKLDSSVTKATPTPKSESTPKVEPASKKADAVAMDFPPPAQPMPVGPIGPYFATAATPTPKAGPKDPVAPDLSSYHPSGVTVKQSGADKVPDPAGGPSPYYATAATPATGIGPKGPTAPDLSSYHPSAVTANPSMPKEMPAPKAGPSPYYATAATLPPPAVKPAEPVAPDLSSYHPSAVTTSRTGSGPMPAPAAGPSPYFATSATPPAATGPAEPTAPGVSAYHATAAMPAAKANMPVIVSGTSPYNGTGVMPARTPAPAPLPMPMPAPMSMPMPMPASPAAMVVPSSFTSNPEVTRLLKTAQGDGPAEARKASIQELVKMKANTPEVLAALDKLGNDDVPAVRAEAIIAAARLKLGR